MQLPDDSSGQALLLLQFWIEMVIKTSAVIAIKRIKKTYGDYMCETNLTQKIEDMEKTTSMKVISVKNINGVVDAVDKINKPILFHEEDSKSSVTV